MGFSIAYVIARWDRPLAELSANEALASLDVDEGYSWERADGWQCFAPVDFYGDEAMPPVERIQDEVGGPVLGMYVLSSSEWELGFRLNGELQRFRPHPSEDESDEEHAEEMTRRWGSDWLAGVSSGLVQWASQFTQVDQGAVHAALAAPHLFPEDTLAALQRVLTLVPADDHAWWGDRSAYPSPERIPGARLTISTIALDLPGLHAPANRYSDLERQLTLVLMDTGFGVWDHGAGAWARKPNMSLETVLHELAVLLPERGWEAR